jgi:DNA modification methylase
MTTRGVGEAVEVTRAKGRPMLSWVGKRPLREVRAFPAQLVERFTPEVPAGALAPETNWGAWPAAYDRGGLLLHGDNKEVLAHLLANGFRGKVDLVYIDPPFDSGADYVRRVQLRGASGTARLDGETYTLGEQIQYTDIWANDTYLQFMYERLLLLKELMADGASLYVHMDSSRGHQVKLVADEVFGPDAFQREIVWRIGWVSGYKSTARNWIRNHDSIYFYVKGGDFAFNKEYIAYPEGYRRRDGAIPEGPGYPIEDTWNSNDLDRMDSIQIMSFSREKLDFPTQKNENLLARIVRASSSPGDLVLDCFVGSGTTAAVAQKLGRRWIAADINKGAIQTTEKRLVGIIDEQLAAAGAGEQLTVDDTDAPPRPSQLSFSVHRVNDYDLQVQQAEAVELAVQHLGVERTRADRFFHGTRGRDLVYIVPFDHPATLLDLQAVADELAARPGEERGVLVVGLGRELSCTAWLDRWNQHRPVNRITLIDLRTDPRHGRFFEHRPAQARVAFERADGRVRVQIEDVISPSIMERLAGQEGIVAPQITDWRWVVDSVAIDASYDGTAMEIALFNVPERRQDLVVGEYEVTVPEGSTDPVAVRITDMLGEEILIVEPRVPTEPAAV